MKILMINKFLHPKGGAETYVFRLGNGLEAKGHEVQYFGMEHEERCVGNAVDQYTSTMDFHGGSRWARILYPIKTIYSREARRKIRKVLDDFKPDVCHLNNFNYQLTPSMILEIVKWRKENHRDCKIVFTAHDYQLLCPNHMMNNPNSHENCDKCVNRQFYQCAKEKCIHRSFARSLIGMAEAYFWNFLNVYRYMDVIICCSEFMKQQMDRRPLYADKTVVLHNFTDPVQRDYKEKKDYVLYFGRYSEEKGISTLLKVSKELPDIPFVLAGSGPLEQQVSQVEHVKNMGFLSGEALKKLIQEARFSIYPSEWYENCPFSVMESLLYGTPVIASRIGGIPELIQEDQNGVLFESGNTEDLKKAIRSLWMDPERQRRYRENCEELHFDTVDAYIEKLMKLYV